MNSQKPLKEFCHMDVETDGLAMNALADVYNEGWELFAPPAWDANSQVWRVLLCRDKAIAPVLTPEPTGKPTLISEALPVTPPAPVTEQPIIPPAPVPEPTTDQPEAESVDEAHAEDTPAPKVDEHPILIVMTTTDDSSMDFEAEVRRIRADKSLSPMEKVEATKEAGDAIIVAKARIAYENAIDAWNRLYPVTTPSFLLPAEVEA